VYLVLLIHLEDRYLRFFGTEFGVPNYGLSSFKNELVHDVAKDAELSNENLAWLRTSVLCRAYTPKYSRIRRADACPVYRRLMLQKYEGSLP
jgi:hypothetical protein